MRTYNGSCWSTAWDFLGRTASQVVFLQETKLDGVNLTEAEAWCSKHGWKPFFGPCNRSRATGEPTAGVAILVRKHIGASPIEAPGLEHRPGVICNGWAFAVHLDAGMRGGIICVSVYLETGQGIGISTCNWQRLCKLGETLCHYGKPFVIGGDFNCEPSDLTNSGWTASIQGRIQSPIGGTCRSAIGNWSSIDYYIISR